MNASAVVTEILCGGCPEQHFERLGVKARCTFDGTRGRLERLTVWELSSPAFKRLCLDTADDLWTPTASWWRELGGSNLGTCNSETTINSHRLKCWNARPEEEDPDGYEPLQWQKWRDVLEYLCDHVGASTERNISACLPDLAAANNMTVGELLTMTLPFERTDAP